MPLVQVSLDSRIINSWPLITWSTGQFYQKDAVPSMSLTMSTSLQWTSSTSSIDIHTTSTISYEPSRTYSFSLAWESPSYTSPPSVSHTSVTPVHQEATSFRPTQSVHVSTTPFLREAPTISNEGLSLIASLSATTISQPPTGNAFIQSAPTQEDEELSIFRGKTYSTQFALPRMTSRSVLHSTNTVVSFNSVFVKESIGMNQTLGKGDQKAMIDKVRL